MKLSVFFNEFSRKASEIVGCAPTFLAACSLMIIWLLSGPIFKFSDTWQLIINTLTTVITFLVVFLIQNTQNRHSAMMQIKLDELLKALAPAKNSIIDLDILSDKQLAELEEHYKKIAHKKLEKQKKD